MEEGAGLPPWDYRILAGDYVCKLSKQEAHKIAKAFCCVLRWDNPDRGHVAPGHPHELPLEELLNKVRRPNLDATSVYQVFEGNDHFEVREEMQPASQTIKRWVKIVGGPDTCEACRAAGTTHTQINYARDAARHAARQRRRPHQSYQSHALAPPVPQTASPWPDSWAAPSGRSWSSWGAGWETWGGSSSSRERPQGGDTQPGVQEGEVDDPWA